MMVSNCHYCKSSEETSNHCTVHEVGIGEPLDLSLLRSIQIEMPTLLRIPRSSITIIYRKHAINFNKNYADFQDSYAGIKHRLLLDYVTFKIIACRDRLFSARWKAPTVDVKLDIEAKEEFQINTKALWLIIPDCIMEYLPPSEIIWNLS